MNYYEVAPNRIIRASSPSFTYSSNTTLDIGQIVIIEIGKQTLPGVVLREVTKPTYTTKPILSTLETTPLPVALVQTSLWISQYYTTHLGSVLQTVLPRGLQKNRRSQNPTNHVSFRDRTKKVFTPEQEKAIQEIDTMSPGSALLHGVTGSGKTAVYIELARRMLARGKSVIILVPEIALTSQLVDEFSHHFDNILLTHSKQTESQRHMTWRDALSADSPRVAIGPRSALFLPLANIGLVVIDEAHEPSFKQEQAPRYSALRVASKLTSFHQAKLVLGSATPQIADYYLAEQSKRPIVSMTQRAVEAAVAPTITLVDMTKRASFKKHRFLSDTLITELERTFVNNQQALIFHNRRGSASTTLCEDCGWSAICPRCFVPYTLHADTFSLQCHICGHSRKAPTSCPECHSASIIHRGIGTKLIETEIQRLFPNKKLARFDGDTDAALALDKKYKELYQGEIDIIIGTQVVAKGLDLPHLRTVGVVQADAGLSLPDYSASERTFQLLAQVIGRVGRSHHPTNVIVQSYQPNHPAVVSGLAQDYDTFYRSTLSERKRGLFPPFTHLLKLTCIYKTEATTIKNSKKLAAQLRTQLSPDVQILGPTPAFYERQHDTYRWQLLLKSPERRLLVDALQHIPPTHWQAELDPISLL